MGPAGNGRSEAKALVDTRIQELHPYEAFLIYRVFSAQKHGVDFPLKTLVLCWVQQEVVPQIRERRGGSVITANKRQPRLKGIERDIPRYYRNESFGHELRPCPSHNPLPVVVALAHDQHRHFFLNNGSYKIEHEVSRRRPLLHSPAHDGVGDVNTGESQPNEIDKLVEPPLSPWDLRNDAQYPNGLFRPWTNNRTSYRHVLVRIVNTTDNARSVTFFHGVEGVRETVLE